MVVTFTTNIPNRYEAGDIMHAIRRNYPDLHLNFDIENAVSNYPCDHSILRVEGEQISSGKIITMVNKAGFACNILQNKICS